MVRYIKTTRGELTVSQTTAAMKEILNSSELGPIKDMETARFVVSVLRWHRHKAEKFAGGIKHIEIRRNPTYPSNRCFWIVRPDGTDTDISYREAISPSNEKADLTQTLRLAIDGWMFDEKKRQWDLSPTDRVTGVKIDSFNDCDLDHYDPEFKVIAQDWLASLDYVPPVKGGDGVIGSVFVNKRDEIAWFEYHAEVARVQLVDRNTHKELTKTRKQRMTLDDMRRIGQEIQ